MRWAIGLGLCVLLGASCGGASGGTKAAPSPPTTTTTVESPETRTWIAAASQSLLADPSRPKDLTTADATCVARALIDTVTVARLEAAGTTLTDLTDPNKNLPPKLAATLPPATKLAMGAAMQACHFGRLIGPLVLTSIAESVSSGYRPDAAAGTCIGEQFDSATSRPLVADVVLNQDPSTSDSRAIATIMVDCLDIGAMMAPQFHLTLSLAERTCINNAARTDKQFVSAMASEIHGTGSGSTASFELFGARTVRCLTPEHLLQIARAKN